MLSSRIGMKGAFFELDKVKLCASFFAIGVGVFSDFFVLRANRLTAGEGLTLIESAASWESTLLFLLWGGGCF